MAMEKPMDARDIAARSCRFYENQYPDIDQVVMVQVKSIAEMGAYCSLLEYNGIEGMILLSELSRRRIRSVNKLIRVGRNEVVLVLRVDREKGYIDLSKRRVSPEDVEKCEEKFNKSKQVYSIVRHTAEVCHRTTQEMSELISWPLYKKYGHAYDAFKLAVLEPDTVLGDLKLPADVQAELIANIRRRLTPQPIKVRADVDVSCFSYEGIDAIKRALKKGMIGEGDEQVRITLLAPPSFVFFCSSLESAKGIKLLEQSIALVKADIEASQGRLEVKIKPRIVSQKDDEALSKFISALAKSQMQKPGDEDENEMRASGSESDEEEDVVRVTLTR